MIKSCILIIVSFWASCSVSVANTSEYGFASNKKLYDIINVHEHIQDKNQAYKYSKVIKINTINSIVLVGSPKEVLVEMDEDKMRFTDSERNNNELLEISRNAPGMFYPFATYSPDDIHIVEKLKVFLKNGGHGLKLYNGHYRFYDIFKIRLDAPHMMEAFAYCEKNRVPIIFHVNSRYYWLELKNILDTYPNLIVNLPHFCMSLIDLDRIAQILNTYPNVYTDMSCGEGELAYTTLKYISRYWNLYRGLIQTYKDRFLFATDMVLTNDPGKDENYVKEVFACYRKMLEDKTYTGILIDQYLENNQVVKTKENSLFNGLQLDTDTMQHIYEINPKNFLGVP